MWSAPSHDVSVRAPAGVIAVSSFLNHNMRVRLATRKVSDAVHPALLHGNHSQSMLCGLIMLVLVTVLAVLIGFSLQCYVTALLGSQALGDVAGGLLAVFCGSSLLSSAAELGSSYASTATHDHHQLDEWFGHSSRAVDRRVAGWPLTYLRSVQRSKRTADYGAAAGSVKRRRR